MSKFTDKNGCIIKIGDYVKCSWIVDGKNEIHKGKITSINYEDWSFEATYNDGNVKQSMQDFQNHIVKVENPSTTDENNTMK